MKLLFVIFSFMFVFNVNATSCLYKMNGETYSLNFEVNTKKKDWREAYTFDNDDFGMLYNNSGSGNGGLSDSGLIVKSAAKQNIFSEFISFGSRADDSTCPVLVSTGPKTYTLIPYNVYTSFFAPNVSFECPNCNKSQINVIDSGGKEKKISFRDFCYELTDLRIFITDFGYRKIKEKIPLIGYFYYNDNYSDLKNYCEKYRKENVGLKPGVAFINFINGYKNYNSNFVVGEYEKNEEWMETCPLVTSINEVSKIKECMNKKSGILKDAIEQFSEKCTENEMKAIQSYASGTTSNFYDKHGVSGYLNNEIKLLFGTFSTECGEAADNLYRSVNNAGRVINTYSYSSSIKNNLIYLNFESNYLNAFSLLTDINPNVKIVKDSCQLISEGLRNIIKEIMNALRVGGTILVILLSIVEVYKAFVAGDDGVRKKMFPLISKRLIALVVFLLLPMIVMILLDFLNKYIPVDTSKCVISDING